MSMPEHVAFSRSALSGYMPRSGVAGSCGGSVFSVLRNLRTVLHSWVGPVYSPTNSAGGVPFSTPSPAFVICGRRLCIWKVSRAFEGHCSRIKGSGISTEKTNTLSGPKAALKKNKISFKKCTEGLCSSRSLPAKDSKHQVIDLIQGKPGAGHLSRLCHLAVVQATSFSSLKVT